MRAPVGGYPAASAAYGIDAAHPGEVGSSTIGLPGDLRCIAAHVFHKLNRAASVGGLEHQAPEVLALQKRDRFTVRRPEFF